MSLLSTLNSQLLILNSLGNGGSPICINEFYQLNAEVFKLTEELFEYKASTPEEEAEICIALLMGYGTTSFFNEEREQKTQQVLNRSEKVLNELEPGVLKCRLLLGCYKEIPVKELLQEAKEIIMGWGGRELTEEEKTMMEEYNGVVG